MPLIDKKATSYFRCNECNHEWSKLGAGNISRDSSKNKFVKMGGRVEACPSCGLARNITLAIKRGAND